MCALLTRCCSAGAEMLAEVFGPGAWENLLNNVPDSWEEDEAVQKIGDALTRPAESENVWLLLPAPEAS